MPSTLTPSGRPHTRGFLVSTPGGPGRTFHQIGYTNEVIPVHLETSPGTYAEAPTYYRRTQIIIIGYISLD